MSEIIEIMARADVDYFWQEGGKRFEHFEKPIAAGVRADSRLPYLNVLCFKPR